MTALNSIYSSFKNPSIFPLHFLLNNIKCKYSYLLSIQFSNYESFRELLVETQRAYNGTYVFPGYSASALLAIIFAIPFGRRLLAHEDYERWRHLGEAFYATHLELFLGNACLGE